MVRDLCSETGWDLCSETSGDLHAALPVQHSEETTPLVSDHQSFIIAIHNSSAASSVKAFKRQASI